MPSNHTKRGVVSHIQRIGANPEKLLYTVPVEPLYRACTGPLFILWEGCTGRFTNPVVALLAGCRISLHRFYENPVCVLCRFYTWAFDARADTLQQGVIDVSCGPYTRRIVSRFDLFVVFSRIKLQMTW